MFSRSTNLAKGVFAGVIGGIAGTAVKTLLEQIAPPRPPGREAPPAILADDIAEEVANESLTKQEKAVAQEAIHWTFGPAAGGAYGALAETFPSTQAGFGTAFGTAFFLMTHESALPALGLTPPPDEMSAREHLNEFASHLAFGLTVEGVRRLVRAMI